jgi:hypothetical protein
LGFSSGFSPHVHWDLAGFAPRARSVLASENIDALVLGMKDCKGEGRYRARMRKLIYGATNVFHESYELMVVALDHVEEDRDEVSAAGSEHFK